MAVRIVRLGTERAAGEGLRIGTVRRPPRGVPKSEFGSRDYYDVWFPNLSPTTELLKAFFPIEPDPKRWQLFRRKFLTEMKNPVSSRELDLLAALSHQTNFSVGCYCEEEALCHRSILRDLLAERDANLL